LLAYVCDRCGKVILRPKGTADSPIKRVIDWGYADFDDPADGGTVEQIDVCNACYESFLSWKVMYHNERLEGKEET
jgi:hypothetical protein